MKRIVAIILLTNIGMHALHADTAASAEATAIQLRFPKLRHIEVPHVEAPAIKVTPPPTQKLPPPPLPSAPRPTLAELYNAPTVPTREETRESMRKSPAELAAERQKQANLDIIATKEKESPRGPLKVQLPREMHEQASQDINLKLISANR